MTQCKDDDLLPVAIRKLQDNLASVVADAY